MSFPWGLTEAEMRVVKAICAGHTTYKALAAHLFLAKGTIRAHLTQIHNKTGARSTADILLAVLNHREARRLCFPALAN